MLLAMPRLKRVSVARTNVTVHGVQRMINAGWQGTIFIDTWNLQRGVAPPAGNERTRITKTYYPIPDSFIEE